LPAGTVTAVAAAVAVAFWKMSGLEVPTELALVPSPALCCWRRPSCSSYTAAICTPDTPQMDIGPFFFTQPINLWTQPNPPITHLYVKCKHQYRRTHIFTRPLFHNYVS